MDIRRLAAIALTATMLLAVPAGTAASSDSRSTNGPTGQVAAAPVVNSVSDIPVTGVAKNGRTFAGTLDITNFRVRNGNLVAIGSLTGELRNASDEVIGSVTNQRVRLPLAIGAITSCDVLRLRLGPVDLDLLGLVVHLDRVVLDITANAGPGNLLGNLLCAVAGLLDRGLNLNGVLADLLRAVLGILQL